MNMLESQAFDGAYAKICKRTWCKRASHLRLILAVTVFTTALSIGRAQEFNVNLAKVLQDTFDFYTKQIPSIKGMSVALYVPGEGLWTATSGSSYDGQAITSDMKFGIASNTKLFVSVSVLRLAELNVLSLSDRLGDWLPTYPNVDPNISLRQLLNHTSGVSDPIFVSPWMDTINNNPTRTFTPEEVLSWLGPPLFERGTSYGYSNVNYILAGMIIEKATGKHVSAFIRDSILTPLGLHETFFDVKEQERPPLAHRWWNKVDYHDTSRIALNSAGGCAGSIFSTPSDIVKWYTALFNGHVISESSLKQLTTFINTGNLISQSGLGISRERTQGMPYWGHAGSTWGYRSKALYDSCSGVALFGVSNSFPSGSDAVCFLLYRTAIALLPTCVRMDPTPARLCQGATGNTFSFPHVPRTTKYMLTYPPGYSGNTYTIVPAFEIDVDSTAVSGELIITPMNDYGAGYPFAWHVNMTKMPARPTITKVGNTLHSSEPNGNQWYNAYGMINRATGQTYDIEDPGTYHVRVTRNGCRSYESNKIDVAFVSVDEVGGRTSINAVPNPTSGAISIIGIQQTTSSIEVNMYNMLGTLVLNKQLSQGDYNLDVSSLSAGLYILEVIVGQSRTHCIVATNPQTN